MKIGSTLIDVFHCGIRICFAVHVSFFSTPPPPPQYVKTKSKPQNINFVSVEIRPQTIEDLNKTPREGLPREIEIASNNRKLRITAIRISESLL